MPTLEPIVISLETKGENAVRSDLKNVAQDLEHLGEAAEQTGTKSEAASKQIKQIGKDNGAKDAAQDVRELGNEAKDAEEKASGLTRVLGGISKALSLEGFKQAGEYLRDAGRNGIEFSKSLIRISEEGRGVEARLESILKQQNRLNDLGTLNDAVQNVTVKGHFDDDDGQREALVRLLSFNTATKDTGNLLEYAARQARTMRGEAGSVADVAEALGKAYNTGQVSPLKKSGLTIDDADIERIQKAYDISKEMGQQTFMATLGPAIQNSTAALEDSLTATQAAANDTARAIDDVQTNIGEGAAEAKQGVDNLGASLLNLVGASPGLAKVAGSLTYLGSEALSGIGSIISLVAQVAIARTAFAAYRKEQDDTAISAERNALAQTESGGASAVAGEEAAAGAVGFETLAKAENAAAAAAVEETGAVATAGTASATAGAAAGAGGAATAAGAGAGVAGGAGAGAAGLALPAAAVAGIAVGVHQTYTGLRDAGQSDTSFESGHLFGKIINPLSHFFGRNPFARGTGDAAEAQSNAIINKSLAKHGKATVGLYSGDEVDETSPTAAQIAQAQAAANAQAKPTAPQAPRAYALDAGMKYPAPSNIGFLAAGVETPVNETNPYDSQIAGLQDELRHAKGKQNADRRAALQDQLVELRRQSQEWRRSNAAQKKETAIAKREATKEQKAEADYRATDTEEGFETRIAAKELERDKAQKDKNDATAAALDYEIAVLGAQKERAMALMRAGEEDDHFIKEAEARKAERKFKGALDRAGLKLNSHAGDMDEGNNKGSVSEATLLARLRAGLSAGQGSFGTPSQESGVFNPYAHDHTFDAYRNPFVSRAVDLNAVMPQVSSEAEQGGRAGRGSAGGRRGSRQVNLDPQGHYDAMTQEIVINTPQIRVKVDSDDDLDMRPLR